MCRRRQHVAGQLVGSRPDLRIEPRTAVRAWPCLGVAAPRRRPAESRAPGSLRLGEPPLTPPTPPDDGRVVAMLGYPGTRPGRSGDESGSTPTKSNTRRRGVCVRRGGPRRDHGASTDRSAPGTDRSGRRTGCRRGTPDRRRGRPRPPGSPTRSPRGAGSATGCVRWGPAPRTPAGRPAPVRHPGSPPVPREFVAVDPRRVRRPPPRTAGGTSPHPDPSSSRRRRSRAPSPGMLMSRWASM